MEKIEKICECCGANLKELKSKYFCEHCFSEYTKSFDDNDAVQIRLNQAQKARLNLNFDLSQQLYESVMDEYPSSLEAKWGFLLSKLGIEFVKEGNTHIPTCHRLSFDNILEEKVYKELIKLSNDDSKKWYIEHSEKIEEIRKQLISISKKTEEYDVFISYKATIEGKPTTDSQYATDIYHELTKQGYKVFLSRISLQKVSGNSYEPYIFSALQSSKAFILVSSQLDYIQSTWVKNEWIRYLELIRDKKKIKNSIIPVYTNISPYDFPEELKGIQGIELTSIDFKENLLASLNFVFQEKKLDTQEQTPLIKKANLIKPIKVDKQKEINPLKTFEFGKLSGEQQNEDINIQKSLENGYNFLNNRVFDVALEQFKSVIKTDYSHYKAYFGVILSELKITSKIFDYVDSELVNTSILKDSYQALEKFLMYAPDNVDGHEHLEKIIYILNMMIYSKRSFSDIYALYQPLFSTIIQAIPIERSYFLAANFLDEIINNEEKFYADELIFKVYSMFRDVLLNYNKDVFVKYILSILENSTKDTKTALKITKDALLYVVDDDDLYYKEYIFSLGVSSIRDAVDLIANKRKYQAFDVVIRKYSNSEKILYEHLNEVLNLIKIDNDKKRQFLFKFVDHIFGYLPNFDLKRFHDALIKFGYIALRFNAFKIAQKYYNEILKVYPEHEMALWGMVLSLANASDEFELVSRRVELIQYKEYKKILNLSIQTDYYTEVYIAIKNKSINEKLNAIIHNRWENLYFPFQITETT